MEGEGRALKDTREKKGGEAGDTSRPFPHARARRVTAHVMQAEMG
jgi:hypothetical protein